ncbi:hypothetical protein AOLI_G00141810 [Acnodon oligacanthus]
MDVEWAWSCGGFADSVPMTGHSQVSVDLSAGQQTGSGGRQVTGTATEGERISGHDLLHPTPPTVVGPTSQTSSLRTMTKSSRTALPSKVVLRLDQSLARLFCELSRLQEGRLHNPLHRLSSRKGVRRARPCSDLRLLPAPSAPHLPAACLWRLRGVECCVRPAELVLLQPGQNPESPKFTPSAPSPAPLRAFEGLRQGRGRRGEDSKLLIE